jgi:hypothetical protein
MRLVTSLAREPAKKRILKNSLIATAMRGVLRFRERGAGSAALIRVSVQM